MIQFKHDLLLLIVLSMLDIFDKWEYVFGILQMAPVDTHTLPFCLFESLISHS